MIKFWASALAGLLAGTLPAWADRTPHPSLKRPGLERPQRAVRPQRASKPKRTPRDTLLQTPSASSFDNLARLSRMSAPDRQRAMAGLTSNQREEIESGLNRFERLAPAEREHLLSRYRRFESLTPSQRDKVRAVVREYTALPPARRAAVKQELDSLQKLSDIERAKRLDSPEFHEHYNPGERGIIEHASSVLPDQL